MLATTLGLANQATGSYAYVVYTDLLFRGAQAISPLHLPYISSISPLYLAYGPALAWRAGRAVHRARLRSLRARRAPHRLTRTPTLTLSPHWQVREKLRELDDTDSFALCMHTTSALSVRGCRNLPMIDQRRAANGLGLDEAHRLRLQPMT